MAGQAAVGRAGSGSLRVVCAWCGALLQASQNKNAMTSHGMCAACAEQVARLDEDRDLLTQHPCHEHH